LRKIYFDTTNIYGQIIVLINASEVLENREGISHPDTLVLAPMLSTKFYPDETPGQNSLYEVYSREDKTVLYALLYKQELE